jgi:hypothetical protein
MDFRLPFSLSGVPEVQTFIGRQKELTDIGEALQGDGSRRRVVLLQGLGGIGKTQLAVSYLKKHADNYSAIVWLDAKTEDALKQSFTITAKRLHRYHPASELLRKAMESKDIDESVENIKEWFSAEGNHRWLLVFDNVDNPKLPGLDDPEAYDIESYFPETHQGSIIVTTRSSRLQIGKVVSVAKLGTVESIEILSSTSGRGNLDTGPSIYDSLLNIKLIVRQIPTLTIWLMSLTGFHSPLLLQGLISDRSRRVWTVISVIIDPRGPNFRRGAQDSGHIKIALCTLPGTFP